MTIANQSDIEVAKVSELLETLRTHGGLSFQYQITCPDKNSTPLEQNPPIRVDLHGASAPFLTARNAELLYAIEQIASAVLRLEPEAGEHIYFDVHGFRAAREQELLRAAEQAIQTVRTTSRPYAFPPMNSRERRLVQLALATSGLRTASSGERPRRWVVVYPDKSLQPNIAPLPAGARKPVQGQPEADLRAAKVRDSFQRRS